MRTNRSLARPLSAVAAAAIALLLGACSKVEAGHGAYAEPKPAAATADPADPATTASSDGGSADTTPGSDSSTPSPSDSDSSDTGSTDTGSTDTGSTDTGSTDSGSTDSPGPSDSPGSSDGPGSGDVSSAAQVAEDFYHAFGAEDGATMCSLMTDAVATGLGSTGDGDCATVARSKAAELSSDARDALTRLVVDESKVTVSGDSATVPAAAMSVDGQHSDEAGAIHLTHESGGWKISGAE
jgi:hypothetical protein